ncbi:hypothetical protein [Polymorphospora rubra]|uniref:Uncharacterized protein n=1 Tax=Polymorphospora rubra TaxID=338584 RepID=A0A810MX11_9ACTN|nr:hypothetical protein [Polymorphospora rubra]BCJ64143.1 hypothetical protein Prubr_11640 [Polymorphospora rubra]
MGIGMLRRHHPDPAEQNGPPLVGEQGPELVDLGQGAVVQLSTGLEPPAGNASQETWADWVIANVEGVDEAEVRAMKRDELREKYGPKE